MGKEGRKKEDIEESQKRGISVLEKGKNARGNANTKRDRNDEGKKRNEKL